jgi:hypothetical protein
VSSLFFGKGCPRACPEFVEGFAPFWVCAALAADVKLTPHNRQMAFSIIKVYAVISTCR